MRAPVANRRSGLVKPHFGDIGERARTAGPAAGGQAATCSNPGTAPAELNIADGTSRKKLPAASCEEFDY
jgi:hypothetical protein